MARGVQPWPVKRKKIVTQPLESPWMLLGGNSHPALARDLAGELAVKACMAEVGSFADGETRVHIPCDVRGLTVVIVQPVSPPVNDHLMALALLVDAAKAAGAARVAAVAPYFGYARQEQRSRAGEARSAQVAARLLGAVGLDHLITIDLHAPALESAFSMPVTMLRPDDLFVPLIRRWETEEPVVVAPDAGGLKRAQRYALALGAPLAVIAKRRPTADAAEAVEVLGDVRERNCVIVDDMASTGRTLTAAAEALQRRGARAVHAVFTHAVMAPGAMERLSSAPLARLATSDSIAFGSHPRLEVVRTGPLLAATVRSLVRRPEV
jgi:ribose-phosphate pyrophosphokinase